MCTVTFIPTDTGFFLTSSRDEKISRWTIPPMYYDHDGAKLLYPKDVAGGGTWIAASLDGRSACLLNGAFENHEKKNNYSKSRGLILIESFNEDPGYFVKNTAHLKSIEPFTLLTMDFSSGELREFFEFRWNGVTLFEKSLPLNNSNIWSSATLYSKHVQLEREVLFKNWLGQNKMTEDKNILDFHNRKHGLSPNKDILMNGGGGLRTVSISQIKLHQGQLEFKYLDVVKNLDYSKKIEMVKKQNA